MKSGIFSKSTLTLFFIVFPMLTTDETGCMGLPVWGSMLFLALILTIYERRKLVSDSLSAVVLWCLAIIISVFSPYFVMSNDVIKYLAFALLLIMLSNHYYNRDFFINIFFIYSIISVVMAILIVLSFIEGYAHVDSIYEGQIRYSIGITGIYKNPNYIGSFINVAAFIFLNLLFFGKMKKIMKIILAALILLILFSVVLTGTRAALLTFLLGFSFTILHFMKIKKISLGYFLLLLLGFILLDQIQNYIEYSFNERGGITEDPRMNSWEWAWKLLKEAPLLGYGINSWDVLKRIGMLEGLHNIFLEFVLNQGIISLFILFYLMTYGIKQVKKSDIFFVTGFCLVTTFPLLFQNGLLDITFWRVLLMNRIVIDYSAYSQNGFMALIINTKL